MMANVKKAADAKAAVADVVFTTKRTPKDVIIDRATELPKISHSIDLQGICQVSPGGRKHDYTGQQKVFMLSDPTMQLWMTFK